MITWITISFCALLAGLFLRVPIFIAIFLSAVGFLILADIDLLLAPQRMVRLAESFTLVAIPMFVLVGVVMNSSGVTIRIFRFALVCVGWWKGGLCHANIFGSIIFGGMSGSAVADAAGIGQIEIKAMTDNGYDIDLASAITAASATIGPVIPPSMPLIIYGMTAGVSIGELFIAGVVPGLVMGLVLMAMVTVFAIRRNYPSMPLPSLVGVFEAFKGAFWALMTPVVLLGGMFTGFFTPTEASAVAAVYSIIVGLGYGDLKISGLPRLMVETVETTGVIMAIVMASAVIGYCFTVSQVPQAFTREISELISSPVIYILVVAAILLVAGTLIEGTALMLIMVPILAPTAILLGIDLVHFGLVFVLAIMIGTLTPPVGIVVFVTARVAGISVERVSKAVLPFVGALLIALLLVCLVPVLSTGLPHLMGF